jgi:hypothetical protein
VAFCVCNSLISIKPISNYADVSWSELSTECSNNLQRLQNWAARITACLDSPKDALETLKWTYLESKRKQHKCILVFKCLSSLVSEYLCNVKYFIRNQSVHNCNTRRKSDWHLNQNIILVNGFVPTIALEHYFLTLLHQRLYLLSHWINYF